MYKRFYHLTTNPFRLAPEPSFCFGHSGYRRAREYLEYALNQGEGFVMVTGPPGTGKTMLVESFLKETDISRAVARRIAVANYGAEDLLRAVAYVYGIEAEDLDRGTIRHRIQQYFIEQERSGRRVLLIIDEAQALQHAALEELRILADLQTQSHKMLQLFLVGHDSLQELMRTPDMEQFQQRVIANYQLVPLNLLDTRNYIEHRLLQAGWNGDPEFTSAAVMAIYQLSKGVPRHINKICNRLLLLGFGNSSHVITDADVQEISAEMRKEQLTPLEAREAAPVGAENITNIAEIRDGLVSVTDLAIRVDKADARAAGVPELARIVAQHKAAADMHHQASAATTARVEPCLDIPAVAGKPEVATLEPVQVNCEPDILRHRHRPQASRQAPQRGRWAQAAVVIAAVVAVATILLVAMPSILDKLDVNALLAMLKTETREVHKLLPRGPAGATEPVGRAPRDVSKVMPEATAAVAGGKIERVPEATRAPTPAARVVLPETVVVEEEIIEPVAATTGYATAQHDNASSPEPNADRVEPVQLEAVAVAPVAVEPDAAVATTAAPADKEALAALLAQGQQALDDYRLMTPEQDNAYYYLREALQLAPDNASAQAGIQRIVDIYVVLTRKEVNKGELARAGRYLNRGLEIQPRNADLLALRQRVDGHYAELPESVPEQPAAGAQARTAPEQLEPAAPPRQEQQSTVLRKRQAAARRRQVSFSPDQDD